MRIEGQGSADRFFPAREVPGSTQQLTVAMPVPVKEQGTQETEPIENTPAKETVEKTLDIINQTIKASNRHLEFRFHEGSGRYSVKVVDSDTQEVIREIPPEKMLDLAARIKKMVETELGLLVDERV